MQRSRRTDRRQGAARWIPEPTTPPGVVAGYAVALALAFAWSPDGRAAAPLASLGQIVGAVLALHAIHEGGHLLAGALVGVPFRAVSLGPLTLLRERRAGRRSGRLVWRVNFSWKRFGGCVEREIAPSPRMRVALTATALGGPAASLVGGALLLAASGAWREVGYASLVIGVINALPVTLLGQASDGMIVRRLWSDRPPHAAWRRQFCGADALPGGRG